jgi:hypothetical protein
MFLKPLAAVTISSKDTNFGGDAATPGMANPCAVFCLHEIKQNMVLNFLARHPLHFTFCSM